MIAPNATIVRAVLFPTPGIASTRNANRRATPWASIAWAMMNAPMKTRIVVEPNGAITSSAGATPISTISAIPSRPPIGIGIASRDPQHDHEQQRGGEPLLRRVHVERQQQEDDEDGGREEQPDRAARLLEALLRRAQLLLAQRAVGTNRGDPLQRVAAATPPAQPCAGACPRQRVAKLDTSAAVTSAVVAVPPRSRVRGPPPASISSTAASTAGGRLLLAEVLEHLGARPDRADRVRDALAGDVGRRSVHGLEHRRELPLGVQVARRRDADRARHRGGEVAEDVAEQVGGDDHVEAPGVEHDHRGERVDQHLLGLQLRVLGRRRARSARPRTASCG